jgi:hypothetical protein
MTTAVGYPHIEFSPAGVPYSSDDFADYWTPHIRRDQQRPPPNGYWWPVNFITEKRPHRTFDAIAPCILNRRLRSQIGNGQCDRLYS